MVKNSWNLFRYSYIREYYIAYFARSSDSEFALKIIWISFKTRNSLQGTGSAEYCLLFHVRRLHKALFALQNYYYLRERLPVFVSPVTLEQADEETPNS